MQRKLVGLCSDDLINKIDELANPHAAQSGPVEDRGSTKQHPGCQSRDLCKAAATKPRLGYMYPLKVIPVANF